MSARLPESIAVAGDLDLVWGAAAIAALIGKSTNATYHLLERGQIPGSKKIGDQWVVSRKVLREFFEGTPA